MPPVLMLGLGDREPILHCFRARPTVHIYPLLAEDRFSHTYVMNRRTDVIPEVLMQVNYLLVCEIDFIFACIMQGNILNIEMTSSGRLYESEKIEMYFSGNKFNIFAKEKMKVSIKWKFTLSIL